LGCVRRQFSLSRVSHLGRRPRVKGAVPVPSRSQLSQARVGALAAVGPSRCPPRRGPLHPRPL